MSTPETLVLWAHIAAGVVAIFAGTGALVATKGGRLHRRAGKLYVGSMAIVVGTVLPLFLFDPANFFRQFLLLVAVFSGYFVFSGYRVLPRNRAGEHGAPADWLVAGFVVLACLGLAGMGGDLLVGGDSFGVVMVVFGLIGVVFGSVDLRAFRAGDAGDWIGDHLTRMIASFIATVTAVSVVNFDSLPEVVTWLGPTALGVPLIVYWRRAYETG